jgi:hypothetical protein
MGEHPRSVAGYFRSHAAFTAAARAAVADGREPQAFTPYPVHGLDAILGIKRSLIGRPVFGVILLGFCIGLHMTWYTMSQDWPLNVGGKPYFAWQTFLVVSLETGLLFGTLTNFLLAAHYCRLFPSPATILPNPRLSDDTFALVLPIRVGVDSAILSAWLSAHGANEVEIFTGKSSEAPHPADEHVGAAHG